MLNRFQLTNFKAFERFTVHFGGRDAYLVGPNNAGKSTLIAGLRAAAEMLRIARRLNATEAMEIDGRVPRGHLFEAEQVGLITENLRHEFHQEPTGLTLIFRGEAELRAVWPVGDEQTGFFWLKHKDVNLIRPREISSTFPTVGIVPVLSPVEHREELLSPKYVRLNLDRHLASRHFRNQLALLRGEDSESHDSRLEEFLEFAQPWVPELNFGPLRSPRYGSASGLDFYYRDPGSHIDKEIFWAGDGMQIWLQLLLHVFRNRDMNVLVLDEPDVFLHADLQRRLVDVLDHLPGQTITATHSAEVLAEAESGTVFWVSADRRRAVRAPQDRILQEMSEALGTHFNLRLARTLRSRCVVFVEGEDIKVLKHLAVTVGAERLRREDEITVIPLVGFDRWEHVEPFVWMSNELLKSTVTVYVVLDRDYRDDEGVVKITTKLTEAGVKPHVWKRHELENYLLVPSAIARLAQTDEDTVAALLAQVTDGLEDEVYAQLQAFHVAKHKGDRLSMQGIAKEAKKRADGLWAAESSRLAICPGKELLGKLNDRLAIEGYQQATARRLARELSESEIAPEVRALLRAIDGDAT